VILTGVFENALNEFLDQILGVLVVVQDKQRGLGAGVLAREGLVLTNNHVAGKGRSLQISLNSGGSHPARVVKRDPDEDLALLEIPVKGHPVATFSTKEPRPGEMVFACGHPWGQRNALTGGVLSAITSARTRSGEIPILRSDVQLAPGNSGGPLLNAAGEVMGLNTMIFGGDQSLAIPTSVILKFLAETIIPIPHMTVPENVI
jgi:serine protease Do